MSDTPRTDALIESVNKTTSVISAFDDMCHAYQAMLDHARALERELAVMRKLERAECVRLLREYSTAAAGGLIAALADWLERQP